VNGLDMTILDTAGLRETADEIERQGVERAKKAIETADQVILVLDGSIPEGEAERKLLNEADGRTLVALNKCDLGVDPARAGIRVSARTGEGLESLLNELKARAGAYVAGEALLTQPRHIGCAKRALASLSDALQALSDGVPQDLVSVDLMAALNALGEITGKNASDEVIGAIFKNFCVGK
jgi:tRNA modification GTPase